MDRNILYRWNPVFKRFEYWSKTYYCWEISVCYSREAIKGIYPYQEVKFTTWDRTWCEPFKGMLENA